MSGARKLTGLEKTLGHRFADPALLAEAITHRSALARDGSTPKYGNERLEFLGDRVLGLVVADMLLQSFPDESEGALARRHATLVRADSLAEVAADIELGQFLKLGGGERAAGGAAKQTILSDGCEGVIGALYLDGGLEAAAAFIRKHWAKRLKADIRPPRDAKTALQEWAQGRGLPLPEYREVKRHGPAHAPHFVVEVGVKSGEAAQGQGANKRAAEQAAAAALLEKLP